MQDPLNAAVLEWELGAGWRLGRSEWVCGYAAENGSMGPCVSDLRTKKHSTSEVWDLRCGNEGHLPARKETVREVNPPGGTP